ncbi:hypothetical protein NXW53_14890 [Bacteroides ovatus]|nr:hypothetical protein [Bacteroides ovatus]
MGNCRNLRKLDISGLKSSSFTGMDLSSNTKLETFLAGDTSLTGVTFAGGAPLVPFASFPELCRRSNSGT